MIWHDMMYLTPWSKRLERHDLLLSWKGNYPACAPEASQARPLCWQHLSRLQLGAPFKRMSQDQENNRNQRERESCPRPVTSSPSFITPSLAPLDGAIRWVSRPVLFQRTPSFPIVNVVGTVLVDVNWHAMKFPADIEAPTFGSSRHKNPKQTVFHLFLQTWIWVSWCRWEIPKNAFKKTLKRPIQPPIQLAFEIDQGEVKRPGQGRRAYIQNTPLYVSHMKCINIIYSI